MRLAIALAVAAGLAGPWMRRVARQEIARDRDRRTTLMLAAMQPGEAFKQRFRDVASRYSDAPDAGPPPRTLRRDGGSLER